MQTLAPSHEVSTVAHKREVHYSATGLWTLEAIADLQKSLYGASKSFIEAGQKFRVLGDLTDFPVQPGPIAEQMQKIQEASAQLGVERMALVIPSALVRLQFRRVSAALVIEFFDDRESALAWLRA